MSLFFLLQNVGVEQTKLIQIVGEICEKNNIVVERWMTSDGNLSWKYWDGDEVLFIFVGFFGFLLQCKELKDFFTGN